MSKNGPLDGEPLVSIGLPVLNGGGLLARALEGLANQTHPNIELIVSDNASTDGTAAVCEGFRQRFPHRVIVYRQAQRLDHMDNFAFVLKQARGEYFMWAAHDDCWSEQFVEKLLPPLKSDLGLGVALCSVRRLYEDGQPHDVVRFVGPLAVDRSRYAIAASIARGSPYHLFIYGLYRTAFLRQAFERFPEVAAGDRLFGMNVALSTRLAYVDDILLDRTVYREDLSTRYGDEDLGRRWSDPFWPYKTVGAFLPYMLKSRTVPPSQKLWLPALLLRLGARYIGTPRAQFKRLKRVFLEAPLRREPE